MWVTKSSSFLSFDQRNDLWKNKCRTIYLIDRSSVYASIKFASILFKSFISFDFQHGQLLISTHDQQIREREFSQPQIFSLCNIDEGRHQLHLQLHLRLAVLAVALCQPTVNTVAAAAERACIDRMRAYASIRMSTIIGLHTHSIERFRGITSGNIYTHIDI